MLLSYKERDKGFVKYKLDELLPDLMNESGLDYKNPVKEKSNTKDQSIQNQIDDLNKKIELLMNHVLPDNEKNQTKTA
jgi:hypothetical protein